MEKLPETEKCLFCGKELPKNRRVSYFCDKECRKKFLASTSHKRVCEVCGKTFSASPASVKWCCSVECSIKRRSQKSLEHITEEMHNFLTDFNAALAPEERIRAKQYTLLSPNGEILEVINLHNWCINCGFLTNRMLLIYSCWLYQAQCKAKEKNRGTPIRDGAYYKWAKAIRAYTKSPKGCALCAASRSKDTAKATVPRLAGMKRDEKTPAKDTPDAKPKPKITRENQMKLNFLFPSQKKIDKFPVIRIAGDENRFCKWMVEHPEIDPRVPPIYQNFVIQSKNCRFIVCYNNTITGFYAKCYNTDIYVCAIFVDYNAYDGDGIPLQADFPEIIKEAVDHDWLYNFCNAACSTIAGVQAYMLYHKPEIVEQIYTPGEERKPSTSRKRITQQPIKVRKTKIKRITLTEQDKPQKEIHYNKLSWHVRGHYRRVGKDKHLVYIQPSVRNRNGKKYSLKGQKYEIED